MTNCEVYRSATPASAPGAGCQQMLRTLYHAAQSKDRVAVRSGLRDLLPEYRPVVPAVPAQAAPYPDDY